MNSLYALKTLAMMKTKGFSKIEPPTTFTIDMVTHVPFNDSCSLFVCKTDHTQALYVWDFLFSEAVDAYGLWGELRRTSADSYINASGLVTTSARSFHSTEYVTFSLNRVLIRPTLSNEYHAFGDRVIVVGDDGVVYVSYKGPFDKVVEFSDDAVTGKIRPWRSVNPVVYKKSVVYIDAVGHVECFEVFPPF